MRQRRLAMNIFGAALGAVSEFGRRQRIDAAAASIARFQDGHPLAGACKLAASHKSRRSGAYDNDMLCLRPCHVEALPDGYTLDACSSLMCTNGVKGPRFGAGPQRGRTTGDRWSGSNVQDPEIRPPDAPHRGRRAYAPGLVLRCDQLQAFLQFGVGLLDLVADFLPLEPGQRGVGEIAPGLPKPFFQRLYIAFESVGHGPTFQGTAQLTLSDSLRMELMGGSFTERLFRCERV